jgi:hypothetical protein
MLTFSVLSTSYYIQHLPYAIHINDMDADQIQTTVNDSLSVLATGQAFPPNPRPQSTAYDQTVLRITRM